MPLYTAVFDSGLGGLTVLKALKESFPLERFVFFGDNKNLPYGDKNPEQLQQLIQENVNALINYEAGSCKALVIACNTASIASYSLLKEQLSIPIIEMIVPTTKNILQKGIPKKIAVLATTFTIRSGVYQTAIENISPNVEVFPLATPKLVPLIESGQDEALELEFKSYLNLIPNDTDVYIMGCTHYPLLIPLLEKFRSNAFITSSSEAIVHEFNTKVPHSSGGEDIFLCSNLTPLWEQNALRILGRSVFWQEFIPI